MNNIIKKKLKIEGMHCNSCAMSIDFDLEDLEGITSATTHYARQESVIEFDKSKIDVKKIIEQIKKTGYTASDREDK